MSALVARGSTLNVTLKQNESSGYYLNITQKRYDALKKNWTKPLEFSVGSTDYTVRLSDFTHERVSSKSNNYNLYSEQNREISDTLLQLQKDIKEKIAAVYTAFLKQFHIMAPKQPLSTNMRGLPSIPPLKPAMW
jgi:DNA mismatch repair ATPase MutS